MILALVSTEMTLSHCQRIVNYSTLQLSTDFERDGRVRAKRK